MDFLQNAGFWMTTSWCLLGYGVIRWVYASAKKHLAWYGSAKPGRAIAGDTHYSPEYGFDGFPLDAGFYPNSPDFGRFEYGISANGQDGTGQRYTAQPPTHHADEKNPQEKKNKLYASYHLYRHGTFAPKISAAGRKARRISWSADICGRFRNIPHAVQK